MLFRSDSYETVEKTFKDYKLKEKTDNTTGEMEVTVNADGTVDVTTYVKYYYEKIEENKPEEPEQPEKPSVPEKPEDNKPSEDKADTNTSKPIEIPNSKTENSKPSTPEQTVKTEYKDIVAKDIGKTTPYTGDVIPIIAGITAIGVIVLNIILHIIRRKGKDKKNFIK